MLLRHILSHLLILVVLKEIHFNLLYWTKVISPRVLFSITPQSKEATHLGSFRQRTKSWRMQERAKYPGLALQIRRTQPSRIETRYTYTSWFTHGSHLCTFDIFEDHTRNVMGKIDKMTFKEIKILKSL